MISVGRSKIKLSWCDDCIPLFLFLFYENDITNTTSQCEQEFNVPLIALDNVWNLGFVFGIVDNVDRQRKGFRVFRLGIGGPMLETLGDLTWFLVLPYICTTVGPRLLEIV